MPETVGRGDRFTVCATVERSTAGDVDLAVLVDGSRVRERTVQVGGSTEECFSMAISGPGDHTVTVTATAGDTTGRRQGVVSVVETGTTVDVFPKRLTLQRGQAGVIRVDIANGNLRAREFTVSIGGLDNLTVDRQRAVTLGTGERATVTVRVVPETLGTSTGDITVRTGNRTVAREDVTVVAAANPALENPVVGAAGDALATARTRFTRLPPRQKWIVLGAAALLVLGAMWWIRRRRHNVMEPQY
ncbi:MAG: hypothetical protein ABEK12_00050 [Candidatus Nanohaloarchaea archaeon]